MKRAKTVVIEEDKPIIEREQSSHCLLREQPAIIEERDPIIVTPIVEKILTANDIFRSQMTERINIRKQKYNKLLEGAF